MSNEKVSQLPTVTNANLTDIICAIQGGLSVQETLQQVATLFLGNTILSYAGNPNGNVAGVIYQLLWDTSDSELWVCTTSGSTSSAVWTLVATSSGSIIPSSKGGTGVANPTVHTLPVAEGSNNFNFLGPLANGQLLIGSTGADPSPGTITAGAGISITNSAGSITISGTASSIGWNVVTTNTAMSPENGYIANGGSLITLTLPSTAVVGTALAAINLSTGGFTIAQNVGQNIMIGSSVSTTGTGGSVSSTAQGDSVYLICAVANTTWITLSGVQGNLTIV
jgi:hypothetical protein